MEKPIYRAWTKGTIQGEGEPRYGLHWINSRRAWFKVFADRIECGDWTVGKSDIKEAVLFKSRQGLIPVKVLRVATADTTYQFGFNPWAGVDRHLPFEFRTETDKVFGGAPSSDWQCWSTWLTGFGRPFCNSLNRAATLFCRGWTSFGVRPTGLRRSET